MSKIEKGYFKKYATRFVKGDGNRYFLLFDLIDKQQEYDEQKLIQKIDDEKLKRSLPRHKHYLYNIILKTLRDLKKNESAEANLREQVENADLLFNRGLIEQAQKLLSKIKAKARKSDLTIPYIKACEVELEIARHDANLSKLKAYLLKEEEIKQVNKLKELTQYKHWAHLMLCYLYTEYKDLPEEDQKIIERIENHIKTQNLSDTNHTGILINYHLINLLLSVLYQRIDEILPKIRKLTEILEKNENYRYVQLHDYMYYNAPLLAILVKLGSEDFWHIKNKVISVINYYNKSITQYAHKKYKQQLNNFEIVFCMYNGDYKHLKNNIDRYIKEYNSFGHQTDILNKVCFCFWVAYYYLIEENHGKAIHWLHKKFEVEEEGETPESPVISRVMFSIIHFEMGNYDILDNQFRCLRRFINKQEEDYALEKTLLKYLKKIYNQNNATDQQKTFKALKEELEKQNLNGYIDMNIADIFNFNAWLESKITGKPFRECLTIKNQLTNLSYNDF